MQWLTPEEDKADCDRLPPGTRATLRQGAAAEALVTVENHLRMPNRTYFLVRFDDGDTLTVYGEHLATR